MNGTTVTTALLQGGFPTYDRVIPKDPQYRAKVKTDALLSAVRQAALLTNDDSKAVQKGTLSLWSRSPLSGEADSQCECQVESAVEIHRDPFFLSKV